MLTLLSRKLAAVGGDVSVHTLRLLLRKFRNVIPVPLQRIRNIVRGFRVAKLEDRVVVQSPVLGLLVLSPDLLALDAKDLDANATRSRNVVGHQLGRKGGVAHDAVVCAGLGEHALG